MDSLDIRVSIDDLIFAARGATRGTLIEFVKRLDEAVGEWDFTLGLAYYFAERQKEWEAEQAEDAVNKPVPVDRTAITTLHGTPVEELRKQQAAQPVGQHNDYIVLTEEERAKGFVRPVRCSYEHIARGCGATTTMGQALAETYARDPKFYGATMCCRCNAHFPVGADGEFVWSGTNEKVGT